MIVLSYHSVLGYAFDDLTLRRARLFRPFLHSVVASEMIVLTVLC